VNCVLSAIMQSLFRCFDEVTDKCLLENLIGKSSRPADSADFVYSSVAGRQAVQETLERKRVATINRLVGCIVIAQSIVKHDKYAGTEFLSMPWILLRFKNFFCLDEHDEFIGYSECSDEFAYAPPCDYAEDFAADEYFISSTSLHVDSELPDSDENIPESEDPRRHLDDGESERSPSVFDSGDGFPGYQPEERVSSVVTELTFGSVFQVPVVLDGGDDITTFQPRNRSASEEGLKPIDAHSGLSPTSVLTESNFGVEEMENFVLDSHQVPFKSVPSPDDTKTGDVEVSGEVFSADDAINVPAEVPAAVSEKLVTTYIGVPSSVDWYTLVEADIENVAGFERVISRNDWRYGLKIAPNIPFPTDDDVILGGIKTTSHGFMQDAINEIFPLNHTLDDRFFQELVETSDIALELDKCSIDASYVSNWDKGDGWNSTLETGMTTTRKTTFREVALSVKKRNMNVPELTSICNIEDISNKIVNTFFGSVVDVNKMVGLPDVILQGEVEWFSEYLKGKNVSEEQYLDPISLVSMDKYRHMIKSQLKPVEDNSLAYERPLAATITYHDKGKVMSTSPIFLAAATRLMLILNDKISIPSGKYHQLFSLDAPSFDIVKCWKEIDFSKFDKSQQELHHVLQKKIFTRLGVPQDFLDTWFGSHERSHISDSTGLKFNTNYQRRTGDACTYLGNTIVTLCVLCYVYDLTDPNILMVVASGDDSLIGSFEELDRSKEHLCSTLFNFEAKFPHNQPFICSKFLLTMPTTSGGRKVVAVPNPVKLLLKLGKKNLDPNQFDDWYTSWLDLIYYFDDNHLISVVSQMCAYRYLRKPSQFLEGAIMSFKNLFSSKTKVKKLLFAVQDEGKKKVHEVERRPSKKDRQRAAAFANARGGSLRIKAD